MRPEPPEERNDHLCPKAEAATSAAWIAGAMAILSSVFFILDHRFLTEKPIVYFTWPIFLPDFIAHIIGKLTGFRYYSLLKDGEFPFVFLVAYAEWFVIFWSFCYGWLTRKRYALIGVGILFLIGGIGAGEIFIRMR